MPRLGIAYDLQENVKERQAHPVVHIMKLFIILDDHEAFIATHNGASHAQLFPKVLHTLLE